MSEKQLEAPPEAECWFEDYAAGEEFACGSVRVDEADIIAFAERFDRQAKHLDPDAAADSAFGGIIASGWHTAALTMQLLIESGKLIGPHTLGIGADELRWLAPVRGGDVLTMRVRIEDASLPRADARRGVIRALMDLFNQDGTRVFTQVGIVSIRRRPQ